MAAMEVSPKHRQIHLWSRVGDASLCGQHDLAKAIDTEVATGWPDCSACVKEAYRRLVAA